MILPFDGKALTADEVTKLADLESREVLLAMRQAQDDAERRARELMDEALGEELVEALDDLLVEPEESRA